MRAAPLVRLCFLATGLQSGLGYLQPTGDSLTTSHVGVWARSHGDLTNNAIRLMEVDGHAEVAGQFSGPADRAAIMDGLRQADMGGGEFIVQLYGSAGRAPRNSFSHFYNPLTKEGFVFPIPSTNGLTLTPDPNLMIRARWEVSIMLGPFPSAIDILDWEYALAVEHMREGERKQAYTHLGRALHILQDVTVPHHATDKPSGLPGTKHTEYEALCEQILVNASQGLIGAVHPEKGGIYCDTCAPEEFVQTAANQSARFIAAATQPGTPEATKVAVVLLAAADKLSAGFLHRFAVQWQQESFAVIKISIERVKMLYKYRKKGSDSEIHALLGSGNERMPDVTAVVVIDGVQRRTSTVRNCNDVRPRELLGSVDVLESSYKTGKMIDCTAVYKEGAVDRIAKPTDDTEVWTFTKRVNDPANAAPVLIQVVVLDDLIDSDDKRVDVAPGEERRNLVFEYNVQTDTVMGTTVEKTGVGMHVLRSKGDKTSPQAAAVTVKVSRTPKPLPTSAPVDAYPGSANAM